MYVSRFISLANLLKCMLPRKMHSFIQACVFRYSANIYVFNYEPSHWYRRGKCGNVAIEDYTQTIERTYEIFLKSLLSLKNCSFSELGTLCQYQYLPASVKYMHTVQVISNASGYLVRI